MFREFTADELMAMVADASSRAEMIDEVTDLVAVRDEIVLVECRGKRRSLVSDAYVEFRWVALVNVVDGRIPRTMDMGEQSVFEFWRSIPPPG